ncbi:uncharacterized protein LOC144437838 [Glandiceps talaboti]
MMAHFYLSLLFVCCIQTVQSNLIVANGTNIVKVDTTNGNVQTVLYDGLQRAVGVDVDVGDTLIFWTDVDMGAIYSGSVYGTQSQPASQIMSGLGRPNGIAVEWVTNYIYWTDGLYGTIEVAKSDGTYRRTLLYGLSNPRGIALDPINGDMYWTDQDSNTIERAKMDGSNPQSLVNTDLYWPNEIVVQSGTLYWIDGYYHKIESLMTSGTLSPTQVADLSSITRDDAMFGLSLYGSTLYFTVWGEGSIYSVPTSGGTPTLLASGFSDSPFGLAFSHPAVQSDTINGCEGSNPCSHLCLPTGGGERSCACPSYGDLTLSSDGKTCTAADEFLFYCAGYDGQIRMLALDGHASGRSIVLDQTARCVALDYDELSEVIYYSDVAFREIRRVELTDKNSETFLEQGIGTVDGLAIDQMHRRLYFTNWDIVYSTNNGEEWARIEMIDLDGTNRRRIIETGLYRPRAIQLDVPNGYMYYTDWNVNPGIVRTDLDGQNPLVIQSQNVENPNGIALTPSNMYWVDSHYDSGLAATLEYSDLDGNNRVEVTHSFPIKVPFGIDVSNNKVYWSDWNETAIFEGDLLTGIHKQLVGNVIDPMGVKYATSNDGPPEPNDVCSGSTCDICVVGNIESSTAKCLCPDKGGKVSDENGQCVEPTNFLLVADVMDIRMIGLDTSDRHAYSVIQAYTDDNIVAIAYDAVNKQLYWSNVHDGVIRRANFFNSEEPQDFYTGARVIDGMDIDESNQMIYWTDYELKSIERMSLDDVDGSTHEVLKTNLTSPRAIVINNGYIYWTDWAVGNAQVLRMDINTNVEETIIQENIQTPNGLAISENKLYVINGDGFKIIRSDLDGSNEETLDFLTNKCNHGYGLQVVGSSLMFSSWDDNAVFLANIQSKRVEKFVDGLIRPTEIILIGGTGGCLNNDCSDGCQEVPGGFHCLCNSGFRLDSDMKTCISCSDTWLVTSSSLCTSNCDVNADCSEDACNPGHYQCVCKGGYQGDGSSCNECPINKFKESLSTSNCQPCPAHSTTKGHRGWTQCICDANYMMNDEGTCEEGEPPCGDLTKPTNGELICAVDSSVYICTLECNNGYMPANSQLTQFICQSNGQWHGVTSADSCIGAPSVTTVPPGVPLFTQCPEGQDLTFNVPPDGDTADIDIDIQAQDGNGNIIEHEIVGGNVEIPGTLQFSDVTRDGIHVNVQAVGSNVWCRFKVIVADPHPPVITSCPSDQSYTTSDDSMSVEWDDPVATDNIELLLPATTDRVSGSDFYEGESTVTVTATDTSENTATCSFTVTIIHSLGECPELSVPKYGALTCSETATAFQCVVYCKEIERSGKITKYYPFKGRNVYNCINEKWNPVSPPRCVRAAPGINVAALAKFVYKGACQDLIDDTDLQEFIDKLHAHLDDHGLCGRGRMRVCTKDSFTVKCGKRSKRQTDNDLIVELEIKISNDVNNSPLEDEEASIDLLEVMQKDMNETMNSLEHLLKNGSLNLEIDGQVIQSDPNSFQAYEPVWTCFEGHVSTSDGCVPCPLGSYYDPTMNDCIFCPANEFQKEEAQLECEQCKDGKYTKGIGSFRESHCLAHEDGFPYVIVIVIVVVAVVVIIIVIIVIIVIVMRRRQSIPKSKGNQDHGHNNEGYYDEIQGGQPKRDNTKKLGKSMYDGEDADYTPLEAVKQSEYETLKTKDVNLSEEIEFTHNDLASANTFTPASLHTADEKV